MNQTTTLSAARIQWVLGVMLSVNILVGMGIDLLSPALPAMTQGLYTSEAVIKNVVSLFMFGYAIGNFCSGILSDTYGRRKFILGGMLVFVFASLIPIVFVRADLVLLARFLQGVSMGTYAVAARAAVSDILTPEQLIRFSPLTAMTWGLGPVIGPVIGGYLQVYFGWQACFYFFAIFAFLEFAALIFIVSETHHQRHPLNVQRLKSSFKEILTHKIFIGAILVMGCSFSLLIVFNTLGPFLIQDSLHYSPIFFGRVALILGLVFLVGTFVCRRFVHHYSLEQIFNLLLPISLVVAIIAMGVSCFWGHNIWVVVIPSMMMFFTTGLLYPTATGKGLSLFRHLAGSSSAVMNMVNTAIVGGAAALMALINAQTMLPLASVYFVLIALIASAYWFLLRKKA